MNHGHRQVQNTTVPVYCHNAKDNTLLPLGHLSSFVNVFMQEIIFSLLKLLGLKIFQ